MLTIVVNILKLANGAFDSNGLSIVLLEALTYWQDFHIYVKEWYKLT